MRKLTLAELIARNMFWNQKASEFLDSLMQHAVNPNVKKYIKSTFRKYLDQEYPAALTTTKEDKLPDWAKGKDDIYELKFKANDKKKLLHYVDYLNTLPADKSINMSFEQMVEHVKDWDKLNKSLNETNTKLIHLYPNGYRWISVFGKMALAREGKLMQHCAGTYYERVKEGKTSVYSLRDPSNKPHVTIEITDKKVLLQIQGKQNQAPVEEYMPYVRDFIQHKYVHFETVNTYYLFRSGLAYVNNNVIAFTDPDMKKVDHYTLKCDFLVDSRRDSYKRKLDMLWYAPKSLKCNSYAIDLEKAPANYLNHIPLPSDKLETDGRIEIVLPKHTKVTLPKHIVCNSLIIYGDKTSKAVPPEDIVASYEVRLPDCFEKLPKIKCFDVKVDGKRLMPLSLESGEVVTLDKLPDGSQIGVTLSEQELESVPRLPKHLYVEEDIWCGAGKLKELPEHLTCRHLYITASSPIKKLPKYLTVEAISIDNNLIKEVPNECNVKRMFFHNYTHGSFKFSDDFIETGSGSLVLHNSKVRLPEGTKLELFSIEETGSNDSYESVGFPEDMTIEEVHFDYSRIQNIPLNIKGVKFMWFRRGQRINNKEEVLKTYGKAVRGLN